MSAPYIDHLLSLCQKLSDLVEVWCSYNKNNFACFFIETRCIRAFDWNRNQRPWMTLKGHYALYIIHGVVVYLFLVSRHSVW